MKLQHIVDQNIFSGPCNYDDFIRTKYIWAENIHATMKITKHVSCIQLETIVPMYLESLKLLPLFMTLITTTRNTCKGWKHLPRKSIAPWQPRCCLFFWKFGGWVPCSHIGSSEQLKPGRSTEQWRTAAVSPTRHTAGFAGMASR